MTTISFTGDIAFSHYFDGMWGKEDLFSASLVEFLQNSDYTVLNLEGAVVEESVSKKPFAHATSCKAIPWLLKLRGNIWSLANNHIMDCNGAEGLQSTLAFARRHGCAVLGAGMNVQEAGKPYIIEKDGGVGLVSVAYESGNTCANEQKAGCFSWDDERLCETIKEIKKKCRWCVLIVHGGDEFSHMPRPAIRRRYRKYLEYGADIVVAHHPHVVQNYETVGNKMIFYSLGNFLFDTDYQRRQFGTDRGMVLKLKFEEDDFSFEAFPVRIDRESRCVERGVSPIIFENITDEQYQKLWPAVAVAFTKTERSRHVFIDPNVYGRYSRLRWLWEEAKACKRERGREILWGRVRFLFEKQDESLKEKYEYFDSV